MSLRAQLSKAKNFDLMLLRGAVANAHDNPNALWMKLSEDKALARIAMRAIIAWSKLDLQLAQEDYPKILATRKPPNRRTRQELQRETSERAAAIVARVERRVIERALDTFRLSDGRLLKSIAWYELAPLERASAREAEVIRMVRRLAQPTDDRLPVGEVITSAQFDGVLVALNSCVTALNPQ